MNEIERIELESENDGCRDEWQRAYADSRMRHDSGRRYAEQLVAQGLHVIVEISTAYCPVTDGIMGEHVFVRRTGGTRGELEKWLASLSEDYFDPETFVQIWPHEPIAVSRPGSDLYDAEAEEQDDIPF